MVVWVIFDGSLVLDEQLPARGTKISFQQSATSHQVPCKSNLALSTFDGTVWWDWRPHQHGILSHCRSRILFSTPESSEDHKQKIIKHNKASEDWEKNPQDFGNSRRFDEGGLGILFNKKILNWELRFLVDCRPQTEYHNVPSLVRPGGNRDKNHLITFMYLATGASLRVFNLNLNQSSDDWCSRRIFLTSPKKGKVGWAGSLWRQVFLSSISRERNARGDDLCDLSPDSYVSCDLWSATWCLKLLLAIISDD